MELPKQKKKKKFCIRFEMGNIIRDKQLWKKLKMGLMMKFKDNAKKEVDVVVKSTPQKHRMEKKSTAAASTVTSLPVK
eukprot:3998378-Ditylum_brightwellii.AAC.1